MSRAKILIVDDDVHLQGALAELLAGEGYGVTVAGTAEDALDKCRFDTFHLCLCDLQLPGKNGISLIKALNESCPATKTVLVTAHGTIRSAVMALKGGAVEYVTKPVKPKRLLALVDALTTDLPSFLPNKLLATDAGEIVEFGGMHARSARMRAVFETVQLAAKSDTTVLITGESGTGKELVARAIHASSARAAGPFIAVHCGAIPQELIASELFGHEKGAFTGATDPQPGKFELAEGGTIFLDEVSTMDERTQVNLLRVLETLRYSRVGGKRERKADVRIVAASNRDLAQMVRDGDLREDLYYRLNVFTVTLPSLRERVEDVPILASALVREFATKYGKNVAVIPPETQRLLSQYAWPGNVRELRNVMEQAVLLSRTQALEPQLLPQIFHRATPAEDVLRIPIGTPMDAIEKEVILRTLAANEGNKTATAEVLGISRRSIYNKLAEYGEDLSSGRR